MSLPAEPHTMRRLCKLGVVFDLDGTLADTLEDLAGSVNRVLERQGFPTHPLDAYRTMVGNGIRTLCQRALGPRGEDPALVDEVTARMREEYRAHHLDHTRLYPGIADLLEDLRDRSVWLGVATNKPHDSAITMIFNLCGVATFDRILGQQPDLPLKPDPTMALRLLDSAGLPPARCLFVGDSDIDMITARAARMRAVGVSWGFRTEAELRGAGADVMIDHPRQLLDHL